MSDETKEPETTAIDKAMDEMQAERDAIDADARAAEARHDPNAPYHWLPTWFLGTLAELDALDVAIVQHCELLRKQVRARRKEVVDSRGTEFRIQVEKDLRAQRGRTKKSVTYPTGVAGFRQKAKHESVVVDDVDKALAHTARTCPDAIKVVRTLLPSALLTHLKATGEAIPGTHVETRPAEERFYAGKHTLTQPQLEGSETPLLEQESDHGEDECPIEDTFPF